MVFVKEEVRISCPICHGTCRRRACSISKSKDIEHKETTKDVEKVKKLQQLHYLIQLLLPVMEKMNLEQSIELETEAKIKGATRYEIPQIKAGRKNFVYWFIKPSSATNRRGKRCPPFVEGNILSAPNRCLVYTQDFWSPPIRGRKNSIAPQTKVETQFLLQHYCRTGKFIMMGEYLVFSGYGGDSILDLRCISYSGWNKELQASVKDIVSRYDFPDTSDVGSCCSLCSNTDNRASGSKLLLETARKDDLSEFFLYYLTVQDLHIEKIQHFQNHWGKGHPVIVRNATQVATNVTWDPVTLFCIYLGKSSEATKTANFLDWFEVELSDCQIFMGSMDGQNNAFMHQKTVKVKGWFCPNLFQEHFPEHFSQIMHSCHLKST